MHSPLPTPSRPKIQFWIPILSGAASALGLFILFGYVDFLNVFTCLAIIPFTSGFLTLLVTHPILRGDRICQILLPWAALLVTMLLPSYWKWRVFTLLVFPVASMGGIAANLLLKKLSQRTN